MLRLHSRAPGSLAAARRSVLPRSLTMAPAPQHAAQPSPTLHSRQQATAATMAAQPQAPTVPPLSPGKRVRRDLSFGAQDEQGRPPAVPDRPAGLEQAPAAVVYPPSHLIVPSSPERHRAALAKALKSVVKVFCTSCR